MRVVRVAVTAAFLLTLVLMVGCGDNGNPASSDEWDGGLVLPSGQAWTDAHEYEVGDRFGLIFHSNGTAQYIDDESGIWAVVLHGTYTVEGNRITGISSDGESITTTYTINGDRLILHDLNMEFVRTSNVSVGSSSNNSTPSATRYTVTVTNGTGGGNYAAGETVRISAGTPPENHVFKNWTTTSIGVVFVNAGSIATTFPMPPNNVTVVANFEMRNDDDALDPFNPNVTYGTLTDSRDNQTYRTVEMPDGKIWMAENLNFETDSGSMCYRNVADSCAKYGRLYTWVAALDACPSGWHLPSITEWNALVGAVGGRSIAGTKLKSSIGWLPSNWSDGTVTPMGTNEFGFSALPGGSNNPTGSFSNGAGREGYWWSSTEYDDVGTINDDWGAHYLTIDYEIESVITSDNNKLCWFSVRCVKSE